VIRFNGLHGLSRFVFARQKLAAYRQEAPAKKAAGSIVATIGIIDSPSDKE